ncbi:MAG TPA: preprotein translocase subunit SecE [Dehalococcoidia bacterium]|jgi:preprotein translocase subunit SecE|nr:preprotein translocase subunit SecE [Dehalococcoidia bacterium]
MVSVRSRRTSGNRVSLVGFLKETISELRKSVWPTREETIRLTIVVLVVATMMGFYLGGLDRILAATFGKYIL